MVTDSHMVCKRAVRILLECFLVWQLFCRGLHENERNGMEIGSTRPLEPNWPGEGEGGMASFENRPGKDGP